MAIWGKQGQGNLHEKVHKPVKRALGQGQWDIFRKDK